MVSPLDKLLNGRRIVLGSQSPRRVELMKRLGAECIVLPSHADESHPDNVDPRELSLILALRKADALVAIAEPGAVLVTADTVVALDGDVLEKPRSLEEARSFLWRLSGRWHIVFSAYVIRCDGKECHAVVPTEVHMSALTDEEIDYYVCNHEVMDKAGAYGIQDWIGDAVVDEIRGAYNSVMGLPTAHVYQALKQVLH